MFVKFNYFCYINCMSERESKFIERLSKIEEEYDEVCALLEANEIVTDNKLYLFYSKTKKQIEYFADGFKNYKKLICEINDSEELIAIETDEDLKKQLRQEIESLRERSEKKLNELKVALSNNNALTDQIAVIEISSKNECEKLQDVILSIKAFAEKNNISFETEILSSERINIKLSGMGAYDKLKNLSGNIRIINKGNAFIICLVVLSVNNDNIEFNESDILVQTLKSGGAGGQHINKTESAVRVKHIPTGITAECEDERSQTANKIKAIENLKNKITQKNLQNQAKNIELQRKNLKNAVFSDTANLIFDYDKNFVTACKTKNTYNLKEILYGEISLLLSEIED